MTHILIPREPSTALLRPFIGCNTQELHEAWAAMVRIAEVQHARAGSQCPAQIEQSAALAGTTIEQYARMFNAACEALGQISDCLGINSDINPGAEPIVAAIEQLRTGGAPVFDDCWKARMLDGRAIERDAQGLGEHPDLPWLDEGMNPPKFFEALGLQLVGVSAQDQLDVDAYDAMAGNYDAKEFNFAAWAPASPEGTGWCLVSIHDTEDGPVAWWLREQPYVAATRPVCRARERDDLTAEECREYLRSGWTRVRGRTEQALMLQLCEALEAGAAPAAVAGPAWDKTRDSLATLLLGLARRPFLDFDVACIALDAATEPGMPLAYMRGAPAAPALEAPAAKSDDLVTVPRDLIGSACAAIDKKRDAPKTLAELRRYTTGDLSRHALAAAPQAPAAPLLGRSTAQAVQALQEMWDDLHKSGSPRVNARAMRYYSDALSTVESAILAAPAAPAVDAPVKVLSQAARDVLAERRRQVEVEGYDTDHDDAHVMGEMGALAALYLMPDGARDWDTTSTTYGATLGQALLPEDWTMPTMGEDRRRDLVKGVACGLAELERWDRASAQTNGGNVT